MKFTQNCVKFTPKKCKKKYKIDSDGKILIYSGSEFILKNSILFYSHLMRFKFCLHSLLLINFHSRWSEFLLGEKKYKVFFFIF